MPRFDPKSSVTSSNPSPSAHIEDAKLYMPSELSETYCCKYCPGGLAAMEDQLHHVEASDSLENLRHELCTHSFTNCFKITNVTGQIRSTCAQETQHRIDDKVRAAELQYRRARDALLKLRGHGAWEDSLRILEQLDVHALNERELTAQEQEDIRCVWERNGVVMEGVDIHS